MNMKDAKKILKFIMPRPYGRLWRAWSTVRHDIPNYLRNCWIYREQLTNTFDWDGLGCLKIMAAHLERVANYLEKSGHEVEESRLQKVKMIRRAVELMRLHIEEDFISWAEEEMGETLIDSQIYFEKIEDSDMSVMKDRLTDEEREHNGRIYNRANDIAKDTWMELFEILRGQDIRIYQILMELENGDRSKQSDVWNAWFDGSGLKHWWD